MRSPRHDSASAEAGRGPTSVTLGSQGPGGIGTAYPSGTPASGPFPQRRGGDRSTPQRSRFAEYAVGTLAAVAFAGILLKVLTSDTVQAALTSVIDRALQ